METHSCDVLTSLTALTPDHTRFCPHRRGLHQAEQADRGRALVQGVAASQAGPHPRTSHLRQTPGHDGKKLFRAGVTAVLQWRLGSDPIQTNTTSETDCFHKTKANLYL